MGARKEPHHSTSKNAEDLRHEKETEKRKDIDMTNLPELKAKLPEMGEISFNYEELRDALEENLKKYDGMVFTEDTQRDARAFLADLRRLDKAIDTERRTVKKVWNVPFDQFERNIKSLQGQVRTRIEKIDDQVQVFEEQRKEQKHQEVQDLFRDMMAEVGELHQYLTFERIYNDRWLNKTYSMDAVAEDIAKAITDTQDSVQTIKSLNSPVEIDLLEEYKRTNDLAKTLQTEAKYKELEEKKQAKRAQEEEAKKKELYQLEFMDTPKAPTPEPEKQEEEQPLPTETPETRQNHPGPTTEQEMLYSFTFQVEATADQIRALSECLETNQIRFKMLKH